MARTNFAPPTGFVIEEEPATAAPAPVAEAPATTPAVPGVPEGFVVETPPMQTWTTTKGTGKNKKTITFQAPEGADEQTIRQLGAKAAGSDMYLRSAVINKGQKPPEVAPPAPEVGMLEAGWEGMKSLGLMGAGDEIQAFGGGLGRMLSGGNYMDGYADELAAARGTRDAAWDQHPYAYGAGGAIGVIPSLALPGGRVAQIEGTLPRVAALSGVGGGYGAVSGFAGADEDRLSGAAVGGAGGAVLGPLLPPVLGAGGRLAQRIGQRTGISGWGRNAMNELETLFSRAPQDAERLTTGVEARRGVGLEPTLADVLDEQGAGTLRAAGQRGAARDTAVQYARGRRVDLQDRVAEQAAPLSPESRPATAVVDEVKAARTAQADEQYAAIRDTVVPVSDDLRRVLDTGAGRRALKNAIETSDSPEEVAGFLKALQRGNEPSELDRVMGLLPEGMNPAAREQVRAQLVSQGVQGTPPMPNFTLDMLDRVKRGLQGRFRDNDASGESRQLQRMVSTLVDVGDSAAPGYAAARANFAAESGLMEAAETGAGMMRGNVDDFVANARNLSDAPVTTADRTTPYTERGLAQTAARRAVETAAGEGPRQALGTADRLAYGRNALHRLEALAGPETAERVQRGMGLVADDARRTNFLDPNAGSKTASLNADMGSDILETGLNLATGNKIGMVRTAMRYLNNMGIREVDGDRLWALATDPARTDEAIDYLIRRGAKRVEATRVVRGLSAKYPGLASGEAYDDSRPVRRNDTPFIQGQ